MLKTKIFLIGLIITPQLVFADSFWDNLWFNYNQQGMHLLKKHKNHDAAIKFNDSNWKGFAYYRDQQYDKAYQEFQKDNSALGLYNQGNTLAQQQKYQEAINAYKQALTKNKNYPDAKHNIQVLEKLLQQQKESEPNKDKQEQQSKEQNQDQKQSEQNKDKKEQQNKEQNQDQKQKQSEQNKDKEEQQSKEQNQDQKQKQSEQNKDKKEEQVKAKMTDKQIDSKERQEIKAILSQIPDDPGGLLRNKFARDYQNEQQGNSNE